MKKPVCQVCKQPFERKYTTTQRVCGQKCAIEYAKQKAIKKQKQEVTKRKKDFKDNDLSYQKSITQPVINRLAVLLAIKHYKDQGREPECISCQTTKKNIRYSGGHYKTTAHAPELRFDLDNIFLQCWYNCNKQKSGNIQGTSKERGFKQGIIEEYGQDRLDYLESYHPAKNYTCADLIAMRKDARERIKRLEIELDLK